MSPLNNAGIFIVTTLFDLYLLVLALRIVFTYIKADIFNPIVNMTFQLTKPVTRPLEKFLPVVKSFDVATLVVFLIVSAIKFFLVFMLTAGFPNPIGLILLAICDYIRIILDILFYTIFLDIILSWLQPGGFPYITTLIKQITYPVLAPFKRLIPPTASGIDLSPIPALIIIKLIDILLVDSFMIFALHMAG